MEMKVYGIHRIRVSSYISFTGGKIAKSGEDSFMRNRDHLMVSAREDRLPASSRIQLPLPEIETVQITIPITTKGRGRKGNATIGGVLCLG
ncbi:unnamed protein product [Arabis nemorensis]|uniref:Uncharacterized protein n=1 Tax=Arabis nemorensis TaxID=586526 RepID=A0A565C5Z2_9BRAS|nr:unnamed protein product [Arabis nemorensis]